MKHFCLFALTVIFTAACNSNDDNNTSTDSNQISFDISGAIESEKTGSSYVVIVESSNTYMISGIDGTSFDDQSFNLSFYKHFKDSSTESPAPGTYPIEKVLDLIDKDGFWLVYADTQNGIEFGSGTGNVSGTLTVTGNSNNRLTGTFEFTATNNETGGSIQVSNGRFSAAID